jgi:hypothetical protein
MATALSPNRNWILAQFSKGIHAQVVLQKDAEATAASPPDPSLGLLYHEIAEADARHRLVIETIATRYGYNPGHGTSGGISGMVGHFTQSLGELGSSPQMRIEQDLSAKASAIHWTTAWVQAFQAIGDSESARELSSVLTEQNAHHNALQEGLNRLVTRGATEGH